MCQATVYVDREGEIKEVRRDVILLESVEGGLRVSTFFEKPLVLNARVQRIDFLKHSVILESEEEGGD